MKPGDLVKLSSSSLKKRTLYGPYYPETDEFQIMDDEYCVTDEHICILLESMKVRPYQVDYLYHKIYTSEGRIGWVPDYVGSDTQLLEVIS